MFGIRTDKIIRVTSAPISLLVLLKNQLQFINNYFKVIGVASSGEELVQVEEIEGIRTYPVKITRKITPFYDILSIIRLYSFFKKEKPEIVHSHTPKAGLVSMVAGWLANVPYRLHTVAGMPLMEATGLKKKILLEVEKLTYFFATKIYPNSSGLKKFIISEQLAPTEKLHIIGHGSSNGIDTKHFSLSEDISEKARATKHQYGINKNQINLLFVGRIVKDKGIEELVQAFDEVSKEYTNTNLFLVGFFEEKLDPVSDNTIEMIKNHESIHLPGFQEDVRTWFAFADIFVFPSYREGLPNVVLQAGCMECPSIVTDITGSNEIIEDGVNGLIIPPKNTETLKESMLKLIKDNSLREKLASNARQIIINKYDRKIVWNALLEEYNSLVGKKVISYF